jgi:hypothetical protein
MTDLEKCKRDIAGKQESINCGWKELVDRRDLSGPERASKKQAILMEVDELKNLIRKLDELTARPD